MYRLSGLQDTHALTALHWWTTVADNQPKLSRPKHYTQFTHKLEPSFLLYPKHIIPNRLWQLWHCWASDNQCTWLHILLLYFWKHETMWPGDDSSQCMWPKLTQGYENESTSTLLEEATALVPVGMKILSTHKTDDYWKFQLSLSGM